MCVLYNGSSPTPHPPPPPPPPTPPTPLMLSLGSHYSNRVSSCRTWNSSLQKHITLSTYPWMLKIAQVAYCIAIIVFWRWYSSSFVHCHYTIRYRLMAFYGHDTTCLHRCSTYCLHENDSDFRICMIQVCGIRRCLKYFKRRYIYGI